MNKFKIFEKDGKQYIERLTHPRFIAQITFDAQGASDIDIQQWIDMPITDVSQLAVIMREAGDFLINKK